MKPHASLLLAVFGGLCLPCNAHSQNSWYLHAGQGGNDNWNTLADWYSAPSGGSNPTAINATGDFYANGFGVRTPSNGNAAAFGGASLTLNGGALIVKDTSSSTATTIGNLVCNAATISNASGGTQILNVTRFTNAGATSLNSGGTTRNINLTIGTLTGNGNLDVCGGGIIYLSVAAAANFLGNICTDAATTLTIQSSLSYGGSLVVGSGSKVILNGSVACASLVVSGTVYAPGTYSFANLNAAYPAIFTGGSGSIAVRAPVSLYLQASQAGMDDWNTLADWFTAPSGGAHPVSINPADDFHTGGLSLRTPASSAPAIFGGASLTLDGGSILLATTGSTPTAAIGNLVSTGGTVSDAATGIESLNVTTFNDAAGIATLNASGANSGFNLTVGTLTGNGGLTYLGGGGGTILLNVADASNYTGTLALLASSTGTLTFGNALFSAGSFVVGSGNTVVLDQAVTFSGLTVGSTVKTPGTYSAAALGFTGSGSLTVKPRPALAFGVNFSGIQDASGTHYPKEADFQYYASKGLTLARLPFTWERIQPTLGGALDLTALAGLDNMVALATRYGMQVILDVHNYGRYNSNIIGSASVPYSAFQDLWTKLATHYVLQTNIYGYDLMNEPHDMGSYSWPTAAQDAVNAIRTVDATHFILVEGESYASASTWGSSNPGLPITDAANRIIYEAHCYFANSNNDQYGTYDAEGAYPDKGVIKTAPFITWLKVNHAWGLLGEYGVPKNDARWNVVLDHFLKYLDDNGTSGTYWAGPGFNPASYPLGIQPTSGVDAPQMSVLAQYPTLTPAVGLKVLSISRLASGHVLLQCLGVQGRSHTIQATTDLSDPTFTTLATRMADGNGNFSFEDTDAASFLQRFYRVTFP